MEHGSEQLAAWIQRSNLKQVEAARKLGFDRTTLNKILKRVRTPGRENAIRLQRIAGVPIEAWTPTPVGKARKRGAGDSRHRTNSSVWQGGTAHVR
jgi:transcriptional regulator with XRE-family HTH domain